MGLGAISMTVYESLLSQGVMRSGQSMIEFGSQQLFAFGQELTNLFDLVGVPRASNLVSGRDLMEALGFSYASIDLDGKWGALRLDFNGPIEGLGQYDVVTNHGTTEHCFDQDSCFRNAHNLCKVGGVMIHLVPMSGYPGHCFYRYGPELFVDLAGTNDYRIMEMWAAKDDGVPPAPVKLNPTPPQYALGNVPTPNVCLCVVMQKRQDKAFVVPIQEAWRQAIAGAAQQ